MKKRAIIFDMDGVLFDSVELATKQIIGQYPGMTVEMHREMLCGNFHEEIKKITLPRIERTEQKLAEDKAAYSKLKAKVPMYEGAKELLEELYRGKKYIIILNTSAYNLNCIPLLENSGVFCLFDLLATADISKSKTEKFNIIKEKYGLDSKDMLFITDTLGDIREADIANVPTVAVTWGAHNRNYFAREEHKNVVGIADSFEELKNYIYGS